MIQIYFWKTRLKLVYFSINLQNGKIEFGFLMGHKILEKYSKFIPSSNEKKQYLTS